MTKIQEVFMIGYPECQTKHFLTVEQQIVASKIISCKTPEMGYTVETCPECGFTRIHYQSCRDRHCPNCQTIPKERWIDSRSAEIIDGSYFHIVFTVPEELNPLFLANQKLLYNLLHKCASETILELSEDKKYLGGKPAIIQVLHTWGRTLNYHPHIHSIVSGTGITKTQQLVGGESRDFFIPIKVISRKFRGKFMYYLKKFYKSGKLNIPDSLKHLEDSAKWHSFCDLLYNKDWCPYIKKTFNGNGNAIEYLGRYTYKVAISNSRIDYVDPVDKTVTFGARNFKTQEIEIITISCEEFVRRFLMHVLPKGFHKIRYFGLLSNRSKKDNLARVFKIQGSRKFIQKFKNFSTSKMILALWNVDITCCPHCGHSGLLRKQVRPTA